MKIAAIVITAIVTHWMAFMCGRADVKQNTEVLDIWNGQRPWSTVSRSYFGKCAPGGNICATEIDKPHWIPRGL